MGLPIHGTVGQYQGSARQDRCSLSGEQLLEGALTKTGMTPR